MPAWTPGRQNGRLVNVSYIVPISIHQLPTFFPLQCAPLPGSCSC
jgi:hypothetical protein